MWSQTKKSHVIVVANELVSVVMELLNWP